MLKKIDHIGIAVVSLAEALPFFEQSLGLTCEKIESVPSQNVRTAFFLLGETYIELIEPTHESSPIAKFLKKNGSGIHHIAFAVDQLQNNLDTLKTKGCRLINTSGVPGAHDKTVAFLHPHSTFGVLMELCQSNNHSDGCSK